MARQVSRLQKARFYASSTVVYGLTVLFAVLLLRPAAPVAHAQTVVKQAAPRQVAATPQVPVVTGRPVRIVLPASGVDLPVDPGYYDEASDSWTLSGYRAQYAMMSSPANNVSGETFIYGHNNNSVFGALRHRTPQPGEEALVYTDNGRVLAYRFTDVNSVGANDTAVLDFAGPSRLVIQTCTGSLNEWRTMYSYAFERVVS